MYHVAYGTIPEYCTQVSYNEAITALSLFVRLFVVNACKKIVLKALKKIEEK